MLLLPEIPSTECDLMRLISDEKLRLSLCNIDSEMRSLTICASFFLFSLWHIKAALFRRYNQPQNPREVVHIPSIAYARREICLSKVGHVETTLVYICSVHGVQNNRISSLGTCRTNIIWKLVNCVNMAAIAANTRSTDQNISRYINGVQQLWQQMAITIAR